MESPTKNTLIKKQDLDAIVFDLDGTLLDADNFALTLDFVRKFTRFHRPFLGKLNSMRFLHLLRKAIEKEPSSETNYVRGVKVATRFYGTDPKRAEDVLHRALRKIFNSMKHHFYPLKGAKELVEIAKEHYPIYLATNPVWPAEFVELRLKWAGIPAHWFKAMTHSKTMHSCKPDENYYWEFIKQEKLTPERCLHIGNDFHKDLIARRTGMSVFIIHETQKELKDLRVPRPTSKKGPAWSGSVPICREFLENIIQRR